MGAEKSEGNSFFCPFGFFGYEHFRAIHSPVMRAV